ncbi:MAG: hypothetical protein ACXWL2_00810 [Candidatus Chromulinivorax sp.]
MKILRFLTIAAILLTTFGTTLQIQAKSCTPGFSKVNGKCCPSCKKGKHAALKHGACVCRDNCKKGEKANKNGVCHKVELPTTSSANSAILANLLSDPVSVTFLDAQGNVLPVANQQSQTIQGNSGIINFDPTKVVTISVDASSNETDGLNSTSAIFSLSAPFDGQPIGITYDENQNLLVESCPQGTCA